MRHALQYTVLLVGFGTTLAIGWPVGAQGLTQQAIGFYLTVIGKPTVVHVGQPAAMPVKLRESVYFKDVIETQADSRAKALFDDDSILTVGENSRVEVSEYIYDPANNQRSSVLRMIQGKARALVGKLFAGLGSEFEVQTPTAPPGVTGAIAGTEVPDVPQPESPSQVVAAVGGVSPLPAVSPAPILPPPTLPPVPGGVTPPSVISGSALGAVVTSTVSGMTVPTVPGALTVPGVLEQILSTGQTECPSCAE